ncbi:hypothetical protein [Streptomyces parvulus]|uniref:hypothetical protein n=1 Tax=Streptomyces parvulus TaxID=146923 RepID=UPI0037160146
MRPGVVQQLVQGGDVVRREKAGGVGAEFGQAGPGVGVQRGPGVGVVEADVERASLFDEEARPLQRLGPVVRRPGVGRGVQPGFQAGPPGPGVLGQEAGEEVHLGDGEQAARPQP